MWYETFFTNVFNLILLIIITQWSLQLIVITTSYQQLHMILSVDKTCLTYSSVELKFISNPDNFSQESLLTTELPLDNIKQLMIGRVVQVHVATLWNFQSSIKKVNFNGSYYRL